MTGVITLVTLELQVSISDILIYTWYMCIRIILLHTLVICFNFYGMTVCGTVDEIQVKIAGGVLAQGQN